MVKNPVDRRVLWSVLILGIVSAGAWGVRKQRMAPPSAGQNAPRFARPSQDGSKVALSQFAGKWVVVYFYPKDSGTDNITEAQGFQRDLDQYKAASAVVLGVNTDSVDIHKQFSSSNAISFDLLTANQQMIDDYDVPTSGSEQHESVERDTFLIAPNGVIITFWDVKNVAAHSAQVLAAIATAKTKPLPAPTRKATSA